MIANQLFQIESGSSNLTSPLQLKIYNGNFSDFSDLLSKYHYKNSKIGGGISYNLVLKYGTEVVGGCVIGAMRHANNYDTKSVELRRMVLSPSCPSNTASYFLSKIIWWLRKYTDIGIVYTFADTTVGHEGTCYKAANFEFVRENKGSNDIIWKGKRYHARSLTIDRPYSYQLRDAIKNGEAEIIKGKPKILYKYEIKR